MDKKGITELRKMFKADGYALEGISMCYVNENKEKTVFKPRAFLTLADEEEYKYLEILKKLISGSFDKNLWNLDFPLAEENEDGSQKLLYDVLKNGRNDEALLEKMYDSIIEHFNAESMERFAIITVFGAYDIPGKSSDNSYMDDASDNVYKFIMTALCPIAMRKGELGYKTQEQVFGQLERDLIVKAPVSGFLFPAFNDRTADIHQVLFYTKKMDTFMQDFQESFFRVTAKMSDEEQKDLFNNAISAAFNDELDINIIAGVKEQLEKYDSDISSKELTYILKEAGADDDGIKKATELVADKYIASSNIDLTKKIVLTTSDTDVKFAPHVLDNIEVKTVENRKYLVIPVDSVDINGLRIK